MKKSTKLGLGAGILLLGMVALSGCTSSFCSTTDKAYICASYDKGTTIYYNEDGANEKLEEINATLAEGQKVTFEQTFDHIETKIVTETVYAYTNLNNSSYVTAAVNDCISNGLSGLGYGSLQYFKDYDSCVLDLSLKMYAKDNNLGSIPENTFATVAEFNEKVVTPYGYVRFADFTFDDSGTVTGNRNSVLFNNTVYLDGLVRKNLSIDLCPSKDFQELYATKITNTVNTVKTCLTTKTGYYGPTEVVNGVTVGTYRIQGKTWGDAWKEGFFEGLLIYPIGALVDSVWSGMASNGASFGWCSIIAILVATLVVRGIMFAVSFKQTTGNAKMTELQPEITKIQNKYPNAQTNNYEKQRMAEEMQNLYKKNKINPLSTIIVLIVQFPVFICVWNALSSSAALSTGSFLGLDMTATLSSVLFSSASWTANAAGYIPGVTALILFILMALSQTFSMLLPQWMQKARAKKVAKLGKNPSTDSTQNKMKWFTYIMLAMIIFMGFSLASAMGVYWFLSALISLVQTLVTQAITDHLKKSKKGSTK